MKKLLLAACGVVAFCAGAEDLIIPAGKTVTSPVRAIASYASETKAVVNARGLSSAKENATRIRLTGRGFVVVFR